MKKKNENENALAATLEKLELVIHDTHKNNVEIWELTAGHESNINKNHKSKEDKYAWMVSDITVMKPTLTCFEVGSRG